jgi:hypothetical protein
MNRKAIYTDYLERFKAALIENYDKLGLRASGKFAESLSYTINKNKLTMYGAYHSLFMENGRGSGGFPPLKAIEEWIEVKRGLPAIFVEKKKQFAYIIARKIAREGIQVPNQHNEGKVISDVVTMFLGEHLYRLLDEVGEKYMREVDFESDFRNLLKAA